MLSLQAEPCALGVTNAMSADESAVKEVAGIELHSRFGGRYSKCAATHRVLHLGRMAQHTWHAIHDPVLAQ